jgi:hypothetical protein
MTYLVTFTCYGARLHGDPRGSVDRHHNRVGAPIRDREPPLLQFERDRLTQSPYLLDEPRREIVLSSIVSVCRYRGWALLAAHVRENHVHAVVCAECLPARIPLDLKTYASRALNLKMLDSPDRKRWTRHFSVRMVPDLAACERAIRYVATKQGEPMALYVAGERTP